MGRTLLHDGRPVAGHWPLIADIDVRNIAARGLSEGNDLVSIERIPYEPFERRSRESSSRLVVQPVGQELFRAALRNYWHDRCAISGLGVPELLRASQIKPWVDCETDAERLDVHNGLLLVPQFDAAFDLGFITINDAGGVVGAQVLPDEARVLLGFHGALRVQGALRDEHRGYLAWHRERVFPKDAR